MLRGGCYRIGELVSGGSDDVCGAVQVGAELLQVADVGGGLTYAAPTAAGAVQDRPDE